MIGERTSIGVSKVLFRSSWTIAGERLAQAWREEPHDPGYPEAAAP
jgi:hypothetical protein